MLGYSLECDCGDWVFSVIPQEGNLCCSHRMKLENCLCESDTGNLSRPKNLSENLEIMVRDESSLEHLQKKLYNFKI